MLPQIETMFQKIPDMWCRIIFCAIHRAVVCSHSTHTQAHTHAHTHKLIYILSHTHTRIWCLQNNSAQFNVKQTTCKFVQMLQFWIYLNFKFPILLKAKDLNKVWIFSKIKNQCVMDTFYVISALNKIAFLYKVEIQF